MPKTTTSENKERHFCFAYYGNAMNQADFSLLNFCAADGCCFKAGDRLVQFVRVSLHQKNGRRAGTIPRIIEEYNKMEGRLEKIEPVAFFPQFSPVVCFKARKQDHPILLRIEAAKQTSAEGYWAWAAGVNTNMEVSQITKDKRAYTSIDDIMRELKLPVPVKRVYDELSEPYFRQYSAALGVGTGCIPVEHTTFIVAEIRRLFNEELSYIEQPAVSVLPPHAHAMMSGDVNDLWKEDEAQKTPPSVTSVRVSSTRIFRVYTKAHNKKNVMERYGGSVGSFLTFYALQWNDAGLESVCLPISFLHRGWTEALLTLDDLIRDMQRLAMPATVELKANTMLRISDLGALLSLLCEEGLLVLSSETKTPKISRLLVNTEKSKPVAPIIKFFRSMFAAGWVDETSVQITATDVIKVINGGETGTYRQTCVRQFMRPFMRDGSVVGLTWCTDTGLTREKYVVDIARVRALISAE